MRPIARPAMTEVPVTGRRSFITRRDAYGRTDQVLDSGKRGKLNVSDSNEARDLLLLLRSLVLNRGDLSHSYLAQGKTAER